MSNDKGCLTWKETVGPEKIKLSNAAAVHTLGSDNSRLSFISNCFGKWACEYDVSQPQWTQKTKHNRNTTVTIVPLLIIDIIVFNSFTNQSILNH